MGFKKDVLNGIGDIKTTTALNMQGLDHLNERFNRQETSFAKHKEADDKFRDKVLKMAEGCPESAHIKEQNGKIERLIGSVKFWGYILTAIVVTMGIVTAITTFMNIVYKKGS